MPSMTISSLGSLRLKDGESAQEHIKSMVELFDALSKAGEVIKDEDRIVSTT